MCCEQRFYIHHVDQVATVAIERSAVIFIWNRKLCPVSCACNTASAECCITLSANHQIFYDYQTSWKRAEKCSLYLEIQMKISQMHNPNWTSSAQDLSGWKYRWSESAMGALNFSSSAIKRYLYLPESWFRLSQKWGEFIRVPGKMTCLKRQEIEWFTLDEDWLISSVGSITLPQS